MAELSSPQPRPIDHCVLPVRSLEIARKRLKALGFTVALKGAHPFGTENACVYMADGTYLEPLAQADEAAEYEAARAGNVFAARDIAFRFRRGEQGFSAVVFGTDDAEVDHAAFVDAGFSAGNMLEFSRDFINASGPADKVSFRLAFAADLRAPDCFFFTCQRVNPPMVEPFLTAHENGVTRLKAVVLAAPSAAWFGPIIRTVAHAELDDIGRQYITFEAANATVELMDNQELRERFGLPSVSDRGLQARAIVFGVPNLKATKTYLLSKGITCEKYRGRVIVHPAPGQGAIFAFEENA